MARKSVLEKHEEYEAIERYISLSEPEVDVLSHELIDLVKTRNVRGETNYKRFEHKNAFDVKTILFQLHPSALDILGKRFFEDIVNNMDKTTTPSRSPKSTHRECMLHLSSIETT